MKLAFIGLRMFPAIQAGLSGIDVRGEEIVRYFSKNNTVLVYVRSWLKPYKKIYKSIIVEPVLTFKQSHVDTFLYSLIASIKVSFTDTKVVFYEGTSSTFFSFIPKFFGKKIIVTVHTQEHLRCKWGLLARFVLLLSEFAGIKSANKVVAVSKSIMEYVKFKYQVNVLLIPFYLQFKKKKSDKLLGKFQLEKDKYILYLGRFSLEKRVDWLINAYKEINHLDIKLVLAGGDIQDNSYVKFLHQTIGNSKDISFVGYVFGDAKETLLSNCRLFVLPSSIEGCSLALMEALSYSKKILVSEMAGLGGQIQKRDFLFRTYDYSDFKYKLNTLLFSSSEGELRIDSDYHYLRKYDFFKRYLSLVE